MAERIRQKTAEEKIKHGEKELNITLSLGVAGTSNTNCLLEELLKQSDIALYRAKDKGRDNVQTTQI